MLKTNELNGAEFRLDIQGLRAIAVLAIIAYHAGLPLPGGFVGVDMFFVISGFVITAMLLREWNRHRKISFRNFYFRRVKRLAPALAFMTVVTVSVSFLVLSPFGPQELVAQTGIGAILSVANIVIARSTGNYFDPAADANPLLHTWSLSVEEQFYWIFPMLLSLGLILGSRLRTLSQKAMLLISLMLAVAAVMMVITNLPEFYNTFPWLSAFYDPLTRFWEFAVGVCLAIAAPKLRSISPRTSGTLAILGTLLVIVSFLLIDEELPFPGRWTLLPVLGTGFLIIAGFNKPNPFTRVLSSAPLVQVGNYSYSLYLWHWPFIVFAYLLSNGNEFAVLLAAVLSFVPAYFSYRYIENPIRELKHPRKSQMIAIPIASILVPVLFLGGYLFLTSQTSYRDWQSAQNTAMSTKYSYELDGCVIGLSGNPNPKPECGRNLSAEGNPIYLVGDSNAGHFEEAIVRAGELLGRPVWIIAFGGCPFTADGAATTSENCVMSNNATGKWLSQAPQGTVVISNADWILTSGVSEVSNSVELIKRVSNGIQNVVDPLLESGHEIMLLQPVPSFNDEDNYWWSEGCGILLLKLNQCQFSIAERIIELKQQEVYISLEDVASWHDPLCRVQVI